MCLAPFLPRFRGKYSYQAKEYCYDLRQTRDVFLLRKSGMFLGPTQLAILWTLWAKQQRFKSDHSPKFSAKV
jgi:hypothetical protein